MEWEIEGKKGAVKDDFSGFSKRTVSSVNQGLYMRRDVMRRSRAGCPEERPTTLSGYTMPSDVVVSAAKAEKCFTGQPLQNRAERQELT